MIEQKCVRTYDKNEFGSNTTRVCCGELTSYLEKGWYVIFITPKSDYTEYIIEKEVNADIPKGDWNVRDKEPL